MLKTIDAPTIQMIALDKLKYGHEHPFHNANSRRTGHDEDLGGFAGDIRDMGVLEPLLAFPEGDEIFVHIGNRRLRALRINADAHMDAPREAPVIIRQITAKKAFEESLSENEQREDLHPIDRYEDYAQLVADGGAVEDIVARRGVTRRTVEQYLAYGNLSQKVRTAWREGLINAEAAQAFTLGATHKAQDKAFDRLKKISTLHAGAIRRAFIPDQGDGARLVNFVGLDVYEAAGGTIIRDLFHDKHGVSDEKLALQLANDKLEAEVLRLTGEGWAWAKRREDMPAIWQQSWRRLETPKMRYTDADKKRLAELEEILGRDDAAEEQNSGAGMDYDERERLEAEVARIENAGVDAGFNALPAAKKVTAGVVLVIDDEGRADHIYGVIEPAPSKAEQRKAAGEDGERPSKPDKKKTRPAAEDATLSAALVSDLAEQLNEAAARVLVEDESVAQAVLLAAIATGTDYGAVRVSVSGTNANALKLTGSKDFAKNFAEIRKMKQPSRDRLFAQVAAAGLAFHAHDAKRPANRDKDIIPILASLDKKKLGTALRKCWNAEDYFARVPKVLLLGAIADGAGKREAERLVNHNKGDLVKYAVTNLPQTGWLPPELRTPHYDGPGAKAAKAAKAKKPAKRGRK